MRHEEGHAEDDTPVFLPDYPGRLRVRYADGCEASFPVGEAVSVRRAIDYHLEIHGLGDA
jgi:hypothetical protein